MTTFARSIAVCSAAYVLFAGATVWAAEQRIPVDVASLGPQVGESVPEFSLPDQNGQMQTLESIAGPNGTMLLFHRSADW